MGLLRVAGWSARQRSRQIVDALGGFARLEARGRRWATRRRASLGETDNDAEAVGPWGRRGGGGGGWVARVTGRNGQRRRSDRAVGRGRGRRRVLAPARGRGRVGA